MNYTLGAPEPIVGETIWMVCPYGSYLCGAEGTFTVEEVSDDEVVGLLVCSVGHRWRVARLADRPLDSEGEQ